MAAKASDVFVDCLQAEGVRYVFGIPGEETLDLNESLADSEIEFVAVRHEQGGAYMADMYGRLTGVPGVCLGTLGPGATNLVTGVADAYLDHAPLVALTGQGDLDRMHKESHQYIDVVSLMRSIVKWNARINSPAIIPEAVRKAFKVAQSQKPGPTHLHLLGTVGLQSRDYALAGFDEADVVITVGYDLVEHDPVCWNPDRDKRIVCIDTAPVEVDEHYITEIDLIGDLEVILTRLAE